jgi:putative ABC transport system permease protein
VVFQFTLSIVLIIATILISRQIRYLQTKDLGYDRENLLYVPLDGNLAPKYSVFREAALGLPGVGGVTEISEIPTNMTNGTQDIDWQGKAPNTIPNFAEATVGYDFLNTMKIGLVQGREFSKDFRADSTGFIINETALAQIGYKDPIGRYLSFWGQKGKIIGVIKDFHFQSLHDAVRPLILWTGPPEAFGTAIIRTRPGQTRAVLDGLEKVCKDLNPKFPFTYQFADAEYARLYKSEGITGSLSVLFAILAIFISCLGLSIFSTEQRTKEIGIRKVLGASLTSLLALLSRDFLGLVGLAFVIAVPVAYWASWEWLRQYAYKIGLEWWIFAGAGGIALTLTLITVCAQTLRAARANPVKSLRTE